MACRMTSADIASASMSLCRLRCCCLDLFDGFDIDVGRWCCGGMSSMTTTDTSSDSREDTLVTSDSLDGARVDDEDGAPVPVGIRLSFDLGLLDGFEGFDELSLDDFEIESINVSSSEYRSFGSEFLDSSDLAFTLAEIAFGGALSFGCHDSFFLSLFDNLITALLLVFDISEFLSSKKS